MNNIMSPSSLQLSQSGGELLDHLATSFQHKQDLRRRQQERLAASNTGYDEAKPDPVLWFPGGDADCGANAGTNYDISTFSIIALMLSIFNIVDLVVSNANNNNNRNNINDNAQNVNDNSNTESNANAGQSSANQVMMVPPGVGRRKRELNQTSPYLLLISPEVEDMKFRIVMKAADDGDGLLHSSWYSRGLGTPRREVEEESMLGMSAATNAWQLLQSSPRNCHLRNFCELGFNGSVWGEYGGLMVEMMGNIMMRFVSQHDEEESELSRALRLGLGLGQQYRKGEERASCDEFYRVECSIQEWNDFVIGFKRLVAKIN